MKLTAPADELRPFIEACADIAPGTNKQPTLEATRFDATASGTAFSATNLRDTVRLYSTSFKAISPGEVFLPSVNLLRVVKEAGKNEISISWDGKSQKATLTWNESRIQLPVEEPKYLPAIEEFADERGFISLKASALTAFLKRTTFATQSAFTSRALHGINVIVKGKSIGLAATDGMRFALVEAECLNPSDVSLNCVIPPVKLQQLKRVHVTPDDTLDVQATPAWLRIRGPRGELAWRMIAGEFPNWEGYVPRRVSKEITVQRKALLDVVRAHKIVRSNLSRDYLLQLTDGLFTLTAKSGIDGDVEAKLEVPWTYGDFVTSLDPEFMEEALSVMTETEIVLGFERRDKPALLREHNDVFTYVYSIVPRAM